MNNGPIFGLSIDFNKLSDDRKKGLHEAYRDLSDANHLIAYDNDCFDIEGKGFYFIESYTRSYINSSDEASSRNMINNLRPTLFTRGILPSKQSTGVDGYGFDISGFLYPLEFKETYGFPGSSIYRTDRGSLRVFGKKESYASLSSFKANYSLYTEDTLKSKDVDTIYMIYDLNPLPIFETDGKPLLLYCGFMRGDIAYSLLEPQCKFDKNGKIIGGTTKTISYKQFEEFGEKEYFLKNFELRQQEYGLENWLEMMKKHAPTYEEILYNQTRNIKLDKRIRYHMKNILKSDA